MDLFECTRLRANISQRQCDINRKGYRAKGLCVPPITSCQGCTGLGFPVQVSLPIQEEVVKQKKITCGRSGCGYGVKKEGDFCKKHQEPITIPVEEQKTGLDDGPLLPRRYASDLSAEEVNALAGTALNLDPVEEKPEVVRDEVKEWVKESLEELEASHTKAHEDHLADAGKLIDAEISPVAPAPPQEQVDPCTAPQSALSRLLMAAVPPPPPLPPHSIVITLDAYRHSKLLESEITSWELAQLITYLLDGELQRVIRAIA